MTATTHESRPIRRNVSAATAFPNKVTLNAPDYRSAFDLYDFPEKQHKAWVAERGSPSAYLCRFRSKKFATDADQLLSAYEKLTGWLQNEALLQAQESFGTRLSPLARALDVARSGEVGIHILFQLWSEEDIEVGVFQASADHVLALARLYRAELVDVVESRIFLTREGRRFCSKAMQMVAPT